MNSNRFTLRGKIQMLDKMEITKFALVGISGAVINLSVLAFLTEYFSMYYLLAAVFAFVIAATSNYIWNKKWTFGEPLRASFLQKYWQFFTVSLTALAVNLFFLYIFTSVFEIYYLISQVLAIGMAFVVNFSGNKLWVFRNKKENYSS